MSATQQPLALPERPRRPRTAYNFFFQDERKRLLDTLPVRAAGKPKGGSHGKIGFKDLAKVISARWKAVTVDQMVHYATLANRDKLRYRDQMFEYKQLQIEHHRQAQALEEQAALSKVEEITPIPIVPAQTAIKESCSEPTHQLAGPSIAELAAMLDKEAIEFLIATLK